MENVRTLSVNQLAELDQQGNVDVIDVRTPIEFRSVHSAIARNIPLDSLDPHVVMRERNGNADQSLYLICKAGSRSAKACQKFADAGYANIVSIEGG